MKRDHQLGFPPIAAELQRLDREQQCLESMRGVRIDFDFASYPLGTPRRVEEESKRIVADESEYLQRMAPAPATTAIMPSDGPRCAEAMQRHVALKAKLQPKDEVAREVAEYAEWISRMHTGTKAVFNLPGGRELVLQVRSANPPVCIPNDQPLGTASPTPLADTAMAAYDRARDEMRQRASQQPATLAAMVSQELQRVQQSPAWANALAR